MMTSPIGFFVEVVRVALVASIGGGGGHGIGGGCRRVRNKREGEMVEG